MPVIVVGADTDAGDEILRRLHSPDREIRVFVSDPVKGTELRQRGYKVAVGDVSDWSHVEGAATRCFSAVLIDHAARDDRERSFADNPEEVMAGWATAVANSGVRRVIWVTEGSPPETSAPEVARVDPAEPDFAQRVHDLDEAYSIS
jgi:uncharacterized protein YbjT (DUF2867 family)